KKRSKIWQLLPHDPSAIERLSRELNVSPVVAQLLLNRQLSEPEQAQRFMNCPLSSLYEPERMPGVEAAAERLCAAIEQKRRISVYGDYDVDGVTATAILFRCLKLLGAEVDFHVPHRLDEGYGLNSETLRRLAENGVQTVVTVDCGVASLVEAEE